MLLLPVRAANLPQFLFLVSLIIVGLTSISLASPKSSCLRNCHLCQTMYGSNFEGHLCAITCIKLRGAIKPDCTDLVSIAPYLDPTVLEILDHNSIDDDA